MHNLLLVQDSFAHALLSPGYPVPDAIRGARRRTQDRRFAVYRNNVVTGLIAALGARYPVTERLVGKEFFSAMARDYAIHCPPRSPVLLHYGESFADFVASFEPAEPLPYLADVARLEWARGVAYHAADVEPLTVLAFASLPAESFGSLRVKLHPSVTIIASRYPIVSIWEAHQDPKKAGIVADWRAEAVIVARPSLEVELRRLNEGADVFLAGLAKGATVAQAAAAATKSFGAFDLAESLKLLIGAEICVGLDLDDEAPQPAPLG